MSDKKVLIISYYFPPNLSIGSVRPKGLAKYLPEFNWKPVILTGKHGCSEEKNFDLIQVGFKGTVRDCLYSVFSDSFLENRAVMDILEFPDGHKNWGIQALNQAREYLLNNKVDAIISTSSPESTHVIAKRLKQEFNIPWIADMRDLWSLNHNYSRSYLRHFVDKIFEKHVLSYANEIVTVTGSLAKIQNDFLRNKKINIIENGFDPETINISASLASTFSIVYTGSIYEEKQRADFLILAIKELIDDNLINPERVNVDFYGRNSGLISKDVKKLELTKVFRYHKPIPREEIFKKQREAQLLLLLNWEDPTEYDVYTGKVFEYFAAKRPILLTGSVKNGLTDLIERTNTGVYALDKDSLKEVILKKYNEFIVNGFVSYNGNEQEINKYSHLEMARKYSEVLNRVVKI